MPKYNVITTRVIKEGRNASKAKGVLNTVD
ncbi:MAG: hypothetical protein UU89_C0021G0006 [Parcubacteria group bacterium GW2011_GWC2_42_11]|nr:MAG: hypothetical protein UU89_C0021G0006 [Parcubacteria group bacterium GW2011_GWC2_42_11]